jgi:hypothetical protein
MNMHPPWRPDPCPLLLPRSELHRCRPPVFPRRRTHVALRRFVWRCTCEEQGLRLPEQPQSLHRLGSSRWAKCLSTGPLSGLWYGSGGGGADVEGMWKPRSSLFQVEGPIRRTREGGSEWEPIKILLEGDGDSNKTNTTSNTRLRLTTQVGQAHAATEVLLDLGTNKQPSEPKHINTHSGNLHSLLPVLHLSDRWTAPVRPVATAVAQQTFQRDLVTSLGPGTKTAPKHNLYGRKILHKT